MQADETALPALKRSGVSSLLFTLAKTREGDLI